MTISSWTPPWLLWHCPACAVEWKHPIPVPCWSCGADPEMGSAGPMIVSPMYGGPSQPEGAAR